MVSFPQASPPTPCAHLYPLPYAPHDLPISFVSILPPSQYWVRSTDHSASGIEYYWAESHFSPVCGCSPFEDLVVSVRIPFWASANTKFVLITVKKIRGMNRWRGIKDEGNHCLLWRGKAMSSSYLLIFWRSFGGALVCHYVTDQSWKIQPTQRHTVTGGCMCRIRWLLMMGARVPETCRA
jgi:hypothetical protein